MKRKEKEEKSKIPPKLLFTTRLDLYSSFDENGIPITDYTGEPISKNSLKKIMKEYDQQKKLYEDYLTTHDGGGN